MNDIKICDVICSLKELEFPGTICYCEERNIYFLYLCSKILLGSYHNFGQKFGKTWNLLYTDDKNLIDRIIDKIKINGMGPTTLDAIVDNFHPSIYENWFRVRFGTTATYTTKKEKKITFYPGNIYNLYIFPIKKEYEEIEL